MKDQILIRCFSDFSKNGEDFVQSTWVTIPSISIGVTSKNLVSIDGVSTFKNFKGNLSPLLRDSPTFDDYPIFTLL
jgi:hypothetical protein